MPQAEDASGQPVEKRGGVAFWLAHNTLSAIYPTIIVAVATAAIYPGINSSFDVVGYRFAEQLLTLPVLVAFGLLLSTVGDMYINRSSPTPGVFLSLLFNAVMCTTVIAVGAHYTQRADLLEKMRLLIGDFDSQTTASSFLEFHRGMLGIQGGLFILTLFAVTLARSGMSQK